MSRPSSRLGWSALLFAEFLGACFDPHFDQPLCGHDDVCPVGLACGVDGVCRSSSPVVDATIPDVALADGNQVDASLEDAVGGDRAFDGDASECNCTGDTLVCTTGNTPCAAGCTEADGVRCMLFQPSNGAPAAGLEALVAIVVPAGRWYVLNTDDGSIVNLNSAGLDPQSIRQAGTGLIGGIRFGFASQSGSPIELATWGVVGMTVTDASARLEVRGARSAAIVAAGPITIHGRVDASGGQGIDGMLCTECAGPGGGAGGTLLSSATGCAPGGPGNYSATAWETGGAGGGMATPGAAGGPSGIAGGVPSAIVGCATSELQPLIGGGGGGRGATSGGSGGARGGGGGGALQLTSLTAVTIDGPSAEVYAGGVGGEGSSVVFGGGGGGAGGAVLLEAPDVTIANGARATANGGGGGAGRIANDGQSGRADVQRAAGGDGDGLGNNNGRGGFGGVTVDSADTDGRPTMGLGGGDGTGGGGGAAGRVRINTLAGRMPTLTGAVVSPAASVGTRPAQ